ncbi:MAG TPA: TIGR04255 family protein [Steroidobacteraceae bacterium]|nr:TIGR04255 family protein [Steroidobacteraceae bacterium]
MAKIRPNLKNAPIVEALIDFQFQSGSMPDLNSLKHVVSKLTECQYKQQGPIFQVWTNLSLNNEATPHTEVTEVTEREFGVRLISADEKFVLQVRLDGFTLSRLSPYESWGNLLDETTRLWKAFVASAGVTSVTRIATRFINNLKLPMKNGDQFQSFLTKPPDVPEELPQTVLGFMQRMVIVNAELGIQANVVQLLQDGVMATDHVPVMLDIDVYKNVDTPPEHANLWNTLNQLRKFKNEIFFSHVTERTVELFE